ncbi:hypothetical protein J6590_047316 [Homalodisca vitripennis]|nr:hypothetical protein J6590_047316 [Homalodisca vitripennis]
MTETGWSSHPSLYNASRPTFHRESRRGSIRPFGRWTGGQGVSRPAYDLVTRNQTGLATPGSPSKWSDKTVQTISAAHVLTALWVLQTGRSVPDLAHLNQWAPRLAQSAVEVLGKGLSILISYLTLQGRYTSSVLRLKRARDGRMDWRFLWSRRGAGGGMLACWVGPTGRSLAYAPAVVRERAPAPEWG